MATLQFEKEAPPLPEKQETPVEKRERLKREKAAAVEAQLEEARSACA